MSDIFRTRQDCTEALLTLVNSDPWLARYALAQCCLFMELGALNELVDAVATVNKDMVAIDKEFFERLVKERFGLQ